MAVDRDPYRLTPPRIFLVRMVVFLLLAAFVALILYRPIVKAFNANPVLNALIIGVMCIGIVLGIRQVVRLFREVRWVNALRRGDPERAQPPILLAPMATMLGDRAAGRSISTVVLRAILDSVGTRLDESREISRYLTGVLVFLGLLGTFYGLLETVGSISGVINSMQTGGDSTAMFDDLKNGLAAPITGMGTSFTASLFGLAGSLILGFLDLQAGQAQNRFYQELEDTLSANASDTAFESYENAPAFAADMRAAIDRLALSNADNGQARGTATALASLAEGIQGLVQHMRNEQQLIRDWVEAQAQQQREIRKLLDRLASDPLDRR